MFCGVSVLFLPRSINSFMYAISVLIGIANALILVRHSSTISDVFM